MKIGILSDSHDHLQNLRKALVLFKDHGCETILHAGDFVSPFVMRLFREFQIRFTGVFGNNDGDWPLLLKACHGAGEIRKGPVEIELAGRKIALMHEPVFLDALRESRKFDLLIYGHTHIAVAEKTPVLVVNPGECCGYLTEMASVAVCDLADLSVNLLSL